MKLPKIDLTRFHIESMEQVLEEPGFSFGHFYSVIQVRVRMVDTNKVDDLYSRKSISLMGRERASEEELSAFIKREAKAHLMWFLDHEVKECLYFDGERYEDPHPEQRWYQQQLEAAEKRERERRKALAQHEKLVAEEITAKYLDMRYESRDYTYRGVLFDLDFDGRPQGKTESLLEAWNKWEPEYKQQLIDSLKYLDLPKHRPTQAELDAWIKAKFPVTHNTEDDQREKDKRSRQPQNFKSQTR